VRKSVLVVVVSLVVLAAASPLFAADNSWLVGKWEMVRDADGDQKDWLEFTADGKAFNISPTGRRVPGTYMVTDSEVIMHFSLPATAVEIKLSYTPDKTKLLARSKKTGNTSEYEKVK
jgi:uncharacterized protein (TIGR03066 family)